MGRIERRKRETWLQFLWALSDFLAILISFPVAYWLRFASPLTKVVPVVKGQPPVGPYVIAGLLLTLAWIPLFHMMGLYRVHRAGKPGGRGVLRLAQAAAIAVTIGAALTFFYRGFSFSRVYFPLLFVSFLFFLVIGRAVVLTVSAGWRRRHPLRVALVGDSPSGWALVQRLASGDPTGIVPCGRLVAAEPAQRPAVAAQVGAAGAQAGTVGGQAGTVPTQAGAAETQARAAEARLAAQPVEALGDLPVLGTYAEAREVVLEQEIDVLILAFPLQEQHQAVQIVTACRGLPVDMEMVPDLLQLLSGTARVREIDGLPVLSLREFPLTGWNGVKKRAFDLTVSLLLLVALSPLLLLIAIAVRLASPGPVFYRQERLGRDGRRFGILKFRTMHVDAEARTGPVWAVAGDERRTRLGVFLRQWSLDELPQLLNVLKGQMSLVGPRPERPHFVHQFSANMPDYLDRHRVKSGITGWAQVNGLRGDTSIEARTRFDLYYVENWSLAFDVKILLLTVRAVLRREGAV